MQIARYRKSADYEFLRADVPGYGVPELIAIHAAITLLVKAHDFIMAIIGKHPRHRAFEHSIPKHLMIGMEKMVQVKIRPFLIVGRIQIDEAIPASILFLQMVEKRHAVQVEYLDRVSMFGDCFYFADRRSLVETGIYSILARLFHPPNRTSLQNA